MEDAINQGSIYGAVGWEPFCSHASIDGAAKVLAESGDVWQHSPGAVMAMSISFPSVPGNQELAARAVRATMDATKWIEDSIAQASTNHSSLLTMGAQLTSFNTTVMGAALQTMQFEYGIDAGMIDGLQNLTEGFLNLGQIAGYGGYPDAMTFAQVISNTSLLQMATTMSYSDSILGVVRLGHVNGDLRQLAYTVAMNTSLWGGKTLFEDYGVQVVGPAPFANSGAVLDAVAAGNIDMGYVTSGTVILKRINSNAQVDVVSNLESEGSAILVNPSYQSPIDLNLRVFATPGPSTIEHQLFLRWATANGFAVYLRGTVSTPSAPQTLQAIPEVGQIDLKWTQPASDGGRAISNYTVYRGTAPSVQTVLALTGTATSYSDARVIPGQKYYYSVSANNSIGEGPMSDEVSACSIVVPSAPLGLVAHAGNGSCALNWSSPVITGSETLTYHVFRDDGPIWNGTETSCIDIGLTNGVLYEYKVSANNSNGWGPNSTAVTAMPLLPSAPSVPLHLAATPGVENVTLHWDAPTFSNGSAVSGYRVLFGTSPTTMTDQVLSSQRDLVLEGLTGRSTYYIVVAARNDAGWGANTSIVTATPLIPPPPSVSFVVTRLGSLIPIITAKENQTLVFNANATYSQFEAFDTLNFTWNMGNGITRYGSYFNDFAYTGIRTYTIKLTVKGPESNAANKTTSFVVTSEPRPDLRILSMTVSPSNLSKGEQGTFTVTLRNVGDDIATSPAVEFYRLMSDGAKVRLGNSSNLVIAGAQATSLEPGQEGTITFNWAPQTIANMTVTAYAHAPREINTADNTDSIGFVVVQIPAPASDGTLVTIAAVAAIAGVLIAAFMLYVARKR